MSQPTRLLLLSAVFFYTCFPTVLLASTFEDVVEQQKDFKIRHGMPASSAAYMNPYSSPSTAEKLILLRAAGLDNLGVRPFSYQKKFDSLSGGTFGVQKRQYSPFEWERSLSISN